MTRAEYWEAVWHVMGDAEPCADWRTYLETYGSVREALAGALAGEHRGEADVSTDSRFPPEVPTLRDVDARDVASFLRRTTGLIGVLPDDYLAELLARWPELATLDGGGE